MTVRVYQSTDVGAPQNTNAAGALIAILDACLVNGYGTGADAKAPAGWSKPFSSTNVAAYKQGIGSNGRYLRVDNSFTANGSNFPKVRAYEDMTGIDTGTGAFPTVAQTTNGMGFHCSFDATPRPWIIVATEKFFCAVMNITSTSRDAHFFGDFVSHKSGDAFNTVFIMGSQATYDNSFLNDIGASFTSPEYGHYLPRMHMQIGSAIQCGKLVPFSTQGFFGSSSGIPAYPSAIDNSLHIAPVYITETAGIRGKMTGIWNVQHDKPFQHGDIITGTGDFASKTFLAVTTCSSQHQFLIEISDTW